MKNFTIDKWFPKSIYHVDNIHIDKLKLYTKEIKKIKKIRKTFLIDVMSSHLLENIHTKEVFKDLFKLFLSHCKNYARHLGYSTETCSKLNIASSWFNISKKGDSLLKHIHPMSMFSGAFYLKSSKTDFITFYNNDDMMQAPEKFNDLSYEYCNYQCEPGKLILFKSNTNHSTNKQIGREKIVISFNIGVTC
jgi:uncharacterized protein (TIGR02466 family)